MKNIFFKNPFHAFFEIGIIGNQHENSIISKQRINQFESRPLNIILSTITFFQKSNQFFTKWQYAQLSLQAMNNFFESFSIHPAYSAFLFGLPYNFFAT